MALSLEHLLASAIECKCLIKIYGMCEASRAACVKWNACSRTPELVIDGVVRSLLKRTVKAELLALRDSMRVNNSVKLADTMGGVGGGREALLFTVQLPPQACCRLLLSLA